MLRIAMLVLPAMIMATSLRAEDDKLKAKLDDEHRQAAEEDEAERNKDESKVTENSFSGKLVLSTDPSQNENPEVIGNINLTDGRTFQIKVREQNLLKTLQPYNNREVKVLGRIRNQGAYLIVDMVVPPPIPVVDTQKKRGF